jgi:hypothetical protein
LQGIKELFQNFGRERFHDFRNKRGDSVIRDDTKLKGDGPENKGHHGHKKDDAYYDETEAYPETIHLISENFLLADSNLSGRPFINHPET